MGVNRIVLYTVDNGCVIPIRKAYKKARYKRKMSRYHDWHGFHKKQRNQMYGCNGKDD